jgi:hypothetical protein
LAPEQEAEQFQAPRYERSPGKFAGRTSYKTDFVEHELPKETGNEGQLVQVVVSKKPKFQGKTVYDEAVTPKNVSIQSIPDEMEVIQASRLRNKSPFKGQSTYKTDYLENEIEPSPRREHSKSPIQAKLRKPKFQGKTHYNSDYQGWKFETDQLEKDSEPSDIFVPERPKFKGISNYDENFTEYDLPKVDIQQSRPPMSSSKKSKPKFKGKTTYKADFENLVTQKLNDLSASQSIISASRKSKRSKRRRRSS